MHRFHIADGQVTYRSRFLRSDSYKQNSEMNRIVVSEFGTLAFPDPCKNIFQRFMSFFERMSEYSLLVMNAKMYRYCTLVLHSSSSDLVLLHFCYILFPYVIKLLCKSLIPYWIRFERTEFIRKYAVQGNTRTGSKTKTLNGRDIVLL